MSEVRIFIPNWTGPKGFQHYRDRDPVWIKNYPRLLSKDEYLGLTLRRRGLLHGLWLAYARATPSDSRATHDGLTSDTRRLSRLLNERVLNADLEALAQAGFIELALASRYQPASGALASRARSREAEGEGTKEPSLPPTVARDQAGGSADALRKSPESSPQTADDFERPDPAAALRRVLGEIESRP